MKVVFLQDNGINESLAITDIAGLLKEEGFECDLFMTRNERNFGREVARSEAGLVVIPMDIWGERTALSIAAQARVALDAPVVFCGTYPMLFPEVVEHPEVDIVVQGESEYPILELARRISEGRGYSDILNLTVKENGEIKRNELRPLISNLDELPLPDRSIYYKYGFMRSMSMKRFTSGRGCPNACSFCFNSKFRKIFKGKGTYVRRKSVERIIREIEDTRAISVLKSVHFSDDLFTNNRKWVFDFCRAYRGHFPGIPFTCNTTVHDVDDEMLGEMKESGCTGIAIGVETGNEKLRMETLNKPYTDEKIRHTAALIKKHGMFLTTFNMLALPYETLENAFETVRFNRELDSDNIRVTFLSPIPRTDLVESAIRDGLLKVDYEEIGARILTPEIEAEKNKIFKTVYALFDVAAVSPALEKIVRKMVRFKVPGILFFLLMLPRMYREKKFFNIRLLSGLFFYLNTTLPQYRTKNFNNFIP